MHRIVTCTGMYPRFLTWKSGNSQCIITILFGIQIMGNPTRAPIYRIQTLREVLQDDHGTIHIPNTRSMRECSVHDSNISSGLNDIEGLHRAVWKFVEREVPFTDLMKHCWKSNSALDIIEYNSFVLIPFTMKSPSGHFTSF